MSSRWWVIRTGCGCWSRCWKAAGCACDLAAAAGMSESAASRAVRWLRAHRIVSSPRRQGRMMYYWLEDAHVRMLLDVTLAHSQHTARCIGSGRARDRLRQ
jgi:DNA-binding transcriptional ArsR family regulator